MKYAFIACLCLITFYPVSAHAATECTLIISYPKTTTLKESGDCQTRRSPASTFKIPLALMGFDSGLLSDAHHPSIPYKDTYNSDMDFQKKTTDPQIWLKESIVWYSQQMTLKLGVPAFQKYVDMFQYGNKDISGTAGKNDGLTHSWLVSSLLISPREQVAFIEKLLSHQLGVSDKAYAQTIAIIPEFKSGEWRVFGKTGSGFVRDANGKSDRSKPQGWFVGFAEKDGKRIIFAKFILDDKPSDTYGGPMARDRFLDELGGFDISSSDK